MDAALREIAVGAISARKPLNILVLATTFPYPPDDGTKIQIFNRIRFLSERNRITLLCIVSGPIPQRFQEAMKPYCRLLRILAPVSRKSDRPEVKTWNLLRSLWYGLPYDIRDLGTRPTREAICRVISTGHYEVIEADVHAAVFLDKAFPPFKVSIFHNVAVDSFRRMIAHACNPVQRLKYRIYRSLFTNYEKTVCRNSDLCVTLTPENETALRRVAPGIPVLNCLTNGIDLDYFRHQPNDRTPSAACFVGLMRYEPNVDAVVHFCRDIFPAVRSTHPQLQFRIVGSSPTPEVAALGTGDGIVVTGHVEDVRPWLLDAGIAVIPVRAGGGILNKILEALALGVPVVTYPACLEGLAVKNGDQLLVAHNAPEFAESVKRLVESAVLRRRLSDNGRRYVESHHQWKPIIAQYEDEIRRRLPGGRRQQ